MAWSKQLAFVFVFVVLAGHARPSLAFWPGSTSFHGRPTSGQGTRVLPMVPTSAAKRSVEVRACYHHVPARPPNPCSRCNTAAAAEHSRRHRRRLNHPLLAAHPFQLE